MPAQSPLVSVILPCYNAHRFLAQTLESLRVQTFRDFETVVVNDGSTNPETLRFLGALPGDTRIVHQKNRGLSGARNTGFREASGRFVLPLDCDDWIEPNFLEKFVAAIPSQEADNSFIFCHLVLEGDKAGVLSKQFNLFEQLFTNQLPYCLLMSKELWRRVGGYDEAMCQGYEDWEFNIRIALSGARAVTVPEALFHYRVSSNGMLLSVSRKRHSKLWTFIQRKHSDAYRLGNLLRLWRIWHHKPSTHRLWYYPPLLAAHRLLPESAFQWIFRQAMRFSHSYRMKPNEPDR